MMKETDKKLCLECLKTGEKGKYKILQLNETCECGSDKYRRCYIEVPEVPGPNESELHKRLTAIEKEAKGKKLSEEEKSILNEIHSSIPPEILQVNDILKEVGL